MSKIPQRIKDALALYAMENCIVLMIIFGKEERTKVETIKSNLSDDVCKAYDRATPYHSGKWVIFEPKNSSDFESYLKLLSLKRKPNRQYG